MLRAKCLPVVFLGKCSLARRQLPGHGVTGLKHTGGRPGPSGRDGDTHVSKRAVEREIDVRDRLVHVEAQGLAVSVVALPHGEVGKSAKKNQKDGFNLKLEPCPKHTGHTDGTTRCLLVTSCFGVRMHGAMTRHT